MSAPFFPVVSRIMCLCGFPSSSSWGSRGTNNNYYYKLGLSWDTSDDTSGYESARTHFCFSSLEDFAVWQSWEGLTRGQRAFFSPYLPPSTSSALVHEASLNLSSLPATPSLCPLCQSFQFCRPVSAHYQASQPSSQVLFPRMEWRMCLESYCSSRWQMFPCSPHQCPFSFNIYIYININK